MLAFRPSSVQGSFRVYEFRVLGFKVWGLV